MPSPSSYGQEEPHVVNGKRSDLPWGSPPPRASPDLWRVFITYVDVPDSPAVRGLWRAAVYGHVTGRGGGSRGPGALRTCCLAACPVWLLKDQIDSLQARPESRLGHGVCKTISPRRGHPTGTVCQASRLEQVTQTSGPRVRTGYAIRTTWICGAPPAPGLLLVSEPDSSGPGPRGPRVRAGERIRKQITKTTASQWVSTCCEESEGPRC